MKQRIDAALSACLARAEVGSPPRLASALRHAVFPGGARIRPRLCFAVAEACAEDHPALTDAVAAAIELLHCASLVHDDLPCFDDADLRRGVPSVHRVYGEALAVLAGDGLIMLAFETLALAGASVPERLPALLAMLSRSVGPSTGLVAGQAWESEPSVPLDLYHHAKTGSLFTASTMAGALAAGRDPAPWRTMGQKLGEAYQVADDLLDALAAPEEAGKPTRQDSARVRPNAVRELGVELAVERLRGLVDEAAKAVPECRGRAELQGLVLLMAERLVPASLRQSAA
ncbi:MAG: polyprenyl synthetase family protein [Deltaproteobacteria bacterium]|nr:polyprenyl synthetase family protein [Deltaproteobacteria bacterium]